MCWRSETKYSHFTDKNIKVLRSNILIQDHRELGLPIFIATDPTGSLGKTVTPLQRAGPIIPLCPRIVPGVVSQTAPVRL